MKRQKVYKAIDTEREYQDEASQNPKIPNMVEDFNIGQALVCIDVILEGAKKIWYYDNPEGNYQPTMQYLRKIAGVCVKMGEKYRMPKRKKYDV